MVTVIATIISALIGAGVTGAGLYLAAQKILKRKLRRLLRKTIRKLQRIEADMDTDNIQTTLDKLAKLATELGYDMK